MVALIGGWDITGDSTCDCEDDCIWVRLDVPGPDGAELTVIVQEDLPIDEFVIPSCRAVVSIESTGPDPPVRVVQLALSEALEQLCIVRGARLQWNELEGSSDGEGHGDRDL